MRRLTLLLATCSLALVLGVPSAPAAQQLITIDTPSRHVDPSAVAFNDEAHPRRLRANVLLPDGYDPARAYPVLFLLHGAGDSYETWARPDRGDVRRTAAGLDAIVVMPEAARGFYTNWFNGGRRGDPAWERFYLEELLAQIESRFAIRPGRRWHAIAGLSMGGFGATYLGGQLPGYFGSVGTFSGLVQHQRPTVAAGFEAIAGSRYEDVFGPMDGPYATGHNPTRLAANLAATRLFAAVGDGTAEPGVESTPQAVAVGGAAEAELRQEADEFVAAAREAGADVTYHPQAGVHDWPYWRRHLREAIAWGLFAPVREDRPARWSYGTIADRGEAWGIRYRFAAPPPDVVRFEGDGERLRVSGTGALELTSAAGCTRTVSLPYDGAVPPDRCPLRVTVRPRSVRRGARTRLRFRVTGPAGAPVRGATVKLGRVRGRTGADGIAALTARLVGRPGVRRPSAKAPGFQAGRATLRVRRR